MRSPEETRVGYATIDIITQHLEDYIKAYTICGIYKGRLDYLQTYSNYKKYLSQPEK